jgi:hypothetical protein
LKWLVVLLESLKKMPFPKNSAKGLTFVFKSFFISKKCWWPNKNDKKCELCGEEEAQKLLLENYVRKLYSKTLSENFVRKLCSKTLFENFVRKLCSKSLFENFCS